MIVFIIITSECKSQITSGTAGRKGQHIDIIIMKRFTDCVDKRIIDYDMNNDMKQSLNNDVPHFLQYQHITAITSPNTTIHDVENPGSDVRQAQRYGGVKYVDGITPQPSL